MLIIADITEKLSKLRLSVPLVDWDFVRKIYFGIFFVRKSLFEKKDIVFVRISVLKNPLFKAKIMLYIM